MHEKESESERVNQKVETLRAQKKSPMSESRAEERRKRRESKKVKHLIIHDNIVSGMKIVASECVFGVQQF